MPTSGLSTEATILAAMKTEAAQFGCDAMSITNQATGSIVPGSNVVRTISHYRAEWLYASSAIKRTLLEIYLPHLPI